MVCDVGFAARMLTESTIKDIQERRFGPSRIALMGSNYLMFRSQKEKSECSKCIGTDSPDIALPRDIDVFTFRVSIKIWETLASLGIASSVIILPADFLKGAASDRLSSIREAYELPRSYLEELDQADVPAHHRIFFFESSMKRRAQKILAKAMKGQHVRIEENVADGGIGIFYTPLGRQHNPNAWIPMGSMADDGKGHKIPIPFCQTICCAFYERMHRMGFTHTIMIMNETESICARQGSRLAESLGYLKVRSLLAFFRGGPEEAELINSSGYGYDNLPILRSDEGPGTV